MQNLPPYFRPLNPNGRRRAPWHDYHSKCIYMITINQSPGLPPFSLLSGNPAMREWKPRAVLSSAGEIIASEISAIRSHFPEVKILRRVIMPEHIHFVIYNTAYSDYHLGEVIRVFKSECTNRFVESGYCQVGGISIFEEGYHDRILLKKGQLQRMLDYVSDNPRRRMLRMMNPGFFRRSPITAPDGSPLECYGNMQMLEDPDIEAVRISSKYTPEILRQRKINWMRTVENGGVLASPFISPEEKRVFDWACDNGGRIILITNNGFGPKYTPKGRLHTLCAEGRLLIVAPAQYQTAAVATTRSACMAMNALAEDIARYQLRAGRC